MLQPAIDNSDPFDSVVLEKHIDNPLLTSNRTITGLNNTISMSLKIVHNKFTPMAHNNQASQEHPQVVPKDTTINKIKRGYGLKHQLYQVPDTSQVAQAAKDNTDEGDLVVQEEPP